MSGQYAELIAKLIRTCVHKGEFTDEDIEDLMGEAASALTTLTQQNELLREANMAYSIHLDAANARANQMGDTTVPVANGGASTTASGTALNEELIVHSMGQSGLTRNLLLRAAHALYLGTQLRSELAEALRGLLLIRDWMIEAGGTEGPLPQDVIQKFAELQVPAVQAARDALAKVKVDRTAPETSTRSADE